MNIAKGLREGDLPDGKCINARAVLSGYELGNKLGIQGTPTIFLPDGRMLGGYLPVPKLLETLGIEKQGG
jgi:thiol:disulfide interchange protein DsbC